MNKEINNHVQPRFDTINRELVARQARQRLLENQQTRFNLLHHFQQQGAVRSDYLGFQPRNRRLAV